MREKVTFEMKVEHIQLLELLKSEYGVPSRSKALELLLDDLLQSDSQAEE